MSFLQRPSTPVSSIQVSPVLRTVMLRDDAPSRNIQHVHCTGCRGKMLPSLDRVFYCMGCRIAVSNNVSVSGPQFIIKMLAPTQKGFS